MGSCEIESRRWDVQALVLDVGRTFCFLPGLFSDCRATPMMQTANLRNRDNSTTVGRLACRSATELRCWIA